MVEKYFYVVSANLNDNWVVKAQDIKGAIVEVISHLKSRLENLEAITGEDVNLDLEVKEIKDTVTPLNCYKVKRNARGMGTKF